MRDLTCALISLFRKGKKGQIFSSTPTPYSLISTLPTRLRMSSNCCENFLQHLQYFVFTTYACVTFLVSLFPTSFSFWEQTLVSGLLIFRLELPGSSARNTSKCKLCSCGRVASSRHHGRPRPPKVPCLSTNFRSK